ncbi:hypothetical protein LX15_005372 [Streptoalloteichus tenebrarius]|uniref:Uncharacterized protein n=1 Tax=Streptoalloteichus tenebrarius (strain ATCC 17920 / DSM 40477 / JCM 4838 / CBS 697.72 / NBRC 16177 / NCIMB 11028 / NRRL B-12390 / A12253. 1 / ISP 5477) TaxID=1933 RepID=A0ABT1I1L6_STRSD|nr:hypothetical protein [Streptoalloteichus tenebrarius]
MGLTRGAGDQRERWVIEGGIGAGDGGWLGRKACLTWARAVRARGGTAAPLATR